MFATSPSRFFLLEAATSSYHFVISRLISFGKKSEIKTISLKLAIVVRTSVICVVTIVAQSLGKGIVTDLRRFGEAVVISDVTCVT